MRHTILILACLGMACTGGPDDTADSAAPCAGLELPECPAECPDDWSASCGEPCEEEEEACGNSIGDGRECIEGLWACSVHSPLEPGECGQVCE